ncbi:A-type ATP synthase subunit I [Methanocella paludicola SANAE]|uniref:A-type ATP synthase subunit I n=1 Tax=Methanocella paludicola (strain DSM 17711 / JCM 13418 / NBRC 101707 / SANAE) TaxID=304371 RepID=D1Z0Z3_METPS|nr:V-type ATPase 116kDa subunit family protein [Methanocella paludicola]BAI62365.1 A-type ATP synthase subunit I [Methanocella paludicola SANAE]
MLHRMKRIQVIGPKGDFQDVVDTLYHAGTVHLEDVCKCVSNTCICLSRVEAGKEAEVLSLLARIGSILFTLPVKADPEKQAEFDKKLSTMTNDEVIAAAQKVIDRLEWTTKELATRKSEREISITALNRYEKVIEKIRHIEHELPLLENYEINILIIQKEFEGVLELVREELEKITNGHFELAHTDIDDESTAVILIFHKKYSEPVHLFLFSANVNEVRLPQEFMGMKFNDMLILIEQRRREWGAEILEINKELEGLSRDWYLELSVLKRHLEDIGVEYRTFNQFGQSEYAFVIMGWIPGKHLRRTRKILHDYFGDRVVIDELKVSPEEMEHAPTYYDNPSFVKPFEFLMGLVRPPKYLEVDPSPLVAIFYPLFFGIMVGDIGYGLLILAISLVVYKKSEKTPWLRDLSRIMAICSIPSILFGFVFGEFFGNLGEEMGLLHPLSIFGISLNRAEAIIPMLLLTIAIGVFHVFLGLALGLVNAVAAGSRKHIAEKAGMLGVLTGILLLAGCVAGVLPQVLLYPSIIVLLASFPAILYGGGIFGTIEVISTMGNILSYARLMAIGLASVILALVANEFYGATGIVAIGIISAVALHALNLVLAMFSPSIHSLRLHMVEFFSKFYEGGGEKFKPFGRPGAQS